MQEYVALVEWQCQQRTEILRGKACRCAMPSTTNRIRNGQVKHAYFPSCGITLILHKGFKLLYHNTITYTRASHKSDYISVAMYDIQRHLKLWHKFTCELNKILTTGCDEEIFEFPPAKRPVLFTDAFQSYTRHSRQAATFFRYSNADI